MKRIILILLCLNFGVNVFTQNNLDSLLKVLTTSEEDTNKINTLFKIGNYYQNSHPDTAIYYYTKATVLAKKLKTPLKQAESLRQIGWCTFLKGEFLHAINLNEKALKIVEKEINNGKNKKALHLKSKLMGNIGIFYDNQSNYLKALEYYFKALKIDEELESKSGITTKLGNIGIVYSNQSNYPKALDYYFKALKIAEELDNKIYIASILGSIGDAYRGQSNYQKALDCYFKSLKINTELGRKSGIAVSLNGIGNVYDEQSYLLREQGDTEEANRGYSKALKYYFEALKIAEEIGSKRYSLSIVGNIGSLYIEVGKYRKAEDYLTKAISMSEELKEIDKKAEIYNFLSELYIKTNRPKQALEAFKKHIELRDSINSEENQKALVQKEIQYEYEKKSAIDSIAHNKEKEIKDAKIAQQQTEIKAKRNQQYALFGGMFLVIVFAGVMYNRFRVTRKQKVIIEEKERETHVQKEIIEEKHKEITDSINYAERIQRSFLATTEMLDEYLNDYFVFFRPKDVVSGDFYWAAKLNNGNFAFACADSTGHGVPGAIMSILNISSLEKSIEIETEPHKILHETRKIIISRLKKDGSAEGGKDGMDCSLLVLNQEKTHLTFASANNSVFIIRNGEILEFKGDKMPVGKHDNADEIFTLHSVDLQKGDVIYSLTDGFPDQFGGNKGKKYMIKNLKNLLLEIAALPLKEQEEKLANEFDKWKGNEEQVDDVCIIGVRV